MAGLNNSDWLVLECIKDFMPQGVRAAVIQKHTKIRYKQDVNRRLRRLAAKGLIAKRKSGILVVYLLAQPWAQIRSVGDKQPAKVFTKKRLPKPKPDKQEGQLHRLELHADLHRTSYDTAKDVLAWRNIPYRTCGRGGTQLLIQWAEITIKLTSKHLIAYGVQMAAPLQVEGTLITDKAAVQTAQAVEGFLAVTKMRCARTLDGRLGLHVKYLEIALTNNPTAKQLPKGRYIPLAYDKAMQRVSIWTDASHPWAFETNKLDNYDELSKWTQGINDGRIKPYEDEMETRKQLTNVAQGLIAQYGINEQVQGSLSMLATELLALKNGGRPKPPPWAINT